MVQSVDGARGTGGDTLDINQMWLPIRIVHYGVLAFLVIGMLVGIVQAATR